MRISLVGGALETQNVITISSNKYITCKKFDFDIRLELS